MNPSRRTAFIVSGAALLYIAFLLQALTGFLKPIPEVSFISVVFPTLLAAGLMYAVGWHVSDERTALAASAAAVVLFLLNPLLCDMPLLIQPWLALRGALLALVIALVWLPMKHWSMFMCSLILMQVFGLAFLFGGNTSGVLLLALVFWVFFNRRRGLAFLSFLAIIAGAWVLAEVARGLYSLIRQHSGDLMLLLQEFRTRYETFLELHPWSLIDQFHERFLRAVSQISLPWMLMAIFLTYERISIMLAERRSGPIDWLMFCSMGALACYFGGSGGAFSEVVWLLMFSAALTPVAGAVISQREVLMSRPARATAGAALLFSAIATWLSPDKLLPFAALASLLMAYLFSIWGVGASWLVRRDRWVAVLIGATLGAWLANGFILFRS